MKHQDVSKAESPLIIQSGVQKFIYNKRIRLYLDLLSCCEDWFIGVWIIARYIYILFAIITIYIYNSNVCIYNSWSVEFSDVRCTSAANFGGHWAIIINRLQQFTARQLYIAGLFVRRVVACERRATRIFTREQFRFGEHLAFPAASRPDAARY